MKRLVYLGGLHPSGVGAVAAPAVTDRGRRDPASTSGIETVVLQAGIVIGSGSASFDMMRHITNRLPAMTTPKWVHNKIQPIAIDDVLHYLAGGRHSQRAYVAHLGHRRAGCDGVRRRDAGVADVAGLRRRLIIAIPFLTPTIASLWIGLVTPMPPGLARPLIESLECDAVRTSTTSTPVIVRTAGRSAPNTGMPSQMRCSTARCRVIHTGRTSDGRPRTRVCAVPRRCRCRLAVGCRCGRRWPASAQ